MLTPRRLCVDVLLCDASWQRLRARILAGEFGFVFAGTPCSTYSAAREHPGGPPPLRSAAHIEGFPHLRGAQKEEVRKANVLVSRTEEACRLVAAQGGGFAIENPEPRNGKPSLFQMPALKRLQADTEARFADFDQCMFGAPTTKPTRIMYHRGGFVLLRARCDHPPQWRKDQGGNWIQSPHESLWGKRTEAGWATKAAALYPPGLCKHLARCIAVTQPVVAAEDGPRAPRGDAKPL